MNNSYITIIKEKRTALSRKRIPLNQNGCTANFRIGVPFEQNLQCDDNPASIEILEKYFDILNDSTIDYDVYFSAEELYLSLIHI